MKDVIKAAKNKMADRVETIWTREIFWNVGHDRRLIVYLLGMIALGVLFYGLYRRYLLWRKVSSVKEPFSREGLYKSMWFLLLDGLFQRRVLRERYAGVMHASILWGFIVLFLGTLAIAVQEDLSLPILGIYFLKGRFYLYLKLVLNIAGLLVLLGVSMAMVRRYLLKPDRLGRSYEDGIILIWIVVVVITGFVLEGLRIYGLKNNWEVWSIGGWVTSQIINRLSPEEISILSVHKTVWWIHLLTAFGFIAYVSFSKLLHVVTSPTNIFIRATGPQGVLSPITNFEGSRSFGVSQIADFSRKQIFDFDACTQCGRCQDNCPAYLSEKPLSPKKVIEELKEEWLERGKLLGKQKESRNEKELLEEDVIWACTFCMACLENCPVYISPFDKIIDLRRNLVLMKSKIYPEIASFFKCVETFGDSFGKGRAHRENWTGGMDLATMSEGVQADILYWVGCQASFHDRGSLIASSLAGLFKGAGIDFAILGKNEICCGDPLRRIGNEYLFQKVAQKNIELLSRLSFKKIVTYCPHCLNMLKNEYPQMGGHFEVIHYTELLRDLIREGKLKVTKEMQKRVAYHDPCYLARANNVHRVPREILKSIPGMRLLESGHSKRQTFCCGAGGGHMWMREIRGKKINEMRLKELAEVKPEIIATSCPYCLVLFEDGVKSLGMEGIKCLDIIEILRDAI